MGKNDKSWLLILAAIGIVYIFLRFWHLTDSCLWFDEIFSVHAAEHSWETLFGFVANDLIHPPFFYVLLKLWILSGGESLLWLRLFPFIFSVAALAPFYLLSRELKLNSAQIALAGGLLAISGSLIKYGQEVRQYSVFLCLTLFSIWLFVRFFYLGKNIWILTLINVLLVYTHYFGWFLVVSEIGAILFLQRIKIRQVLIMFGILLVSFTPWILTIRETAENSALLSQNIGWIAKPDLPTVFVFIFDLIEPFYFQQSNVEPTSVFILTIPLLLIFTTAFGLYFYNWAKREEREKQNFLLLLIFIGGPVFLAFAISWILPYSIWGTRHLIFVFAPLAILAAIILTDVKIIQLKISLITLVICIGGFAFLLYAVRPKPVYIWCAWENLAGGLDKTKPAKIYVFEDLVAYNFWFALRAEVQANFQIIKVEGIEGLTEDKAYFIPRGFDAIQKTDEKGMTGERFFVAFRESAWNEKHPPLNNLVNQGYRIGEPKVIETQGLKAFLVEIGK